MTNLENDLCFTVLEQSLKNDKPAIFGSMP